MELEYYQRKINDVITKCPIEAGVEILVYNILDEVLDPKVFSLVDINRLQNKRDLRLTTNGGMADIAILSCDFKYKEASESNHVYGFVEVKATGEQLMETKQIIGQKSSTNHLLYTNGLVWKYYNGDECTPKWTIILTQDSSEYVKGRKKVKIAPKEFADLIVRLEKIKWN